MSRIGLLGISGKPITSGHFSLIELAANECDQVKLFISLSDRKRPGEFPIYGKDMKLIWNKYLEPSLPGNVDVKYAVSIPTPVQSIFSVLEEAEDANDTKNVYVIYSDPVDMERFIDKSLARSAPSIFKNGKIEKRIVERTETVNISGTKMRSFLASKNIKKFISFLPPEVQSDGKKIYDILMRNSTNESLLRTYVSAVVKRQI